MFRIQFVENAVLALLKYLVSIVGNYGIAIIITTLIVKILLFPLTLKQEKSMLKMKELQPKIDEINRKYKGDKAKINEMTAKLYQEEQVNPLASCLPLLLQLPIFIALYYTFISSAIPETATFLWFNLKKPDALYTIGKFSINLLPILSTGLMILQQRLMSGNQSSGGSETEKSMQNMLYFMPILMLVIFYKMPSGVNLYYAVNTLLSILQQLYVIKKVRQNG
ncbi:YidC/Oxa1 family membrane protein insertase [Caviibacter abscessus]|uniref:YidC/Oxa1 family membrane protein insertase n=1 Tax=Caviibacter abscessus TaxID=1766719 RepID=UPI000834E405|nr:YidC/Oxa1 family membrane protein insertase [Caviibacter abscessus]